MQSLLKGVLAITLVIMCGCNSCPDNLIGTWYEWDQFNPDGFTSPGLAVRFNQDSTGVMWIHEHFKISTKFKPDTFVWSQRANRRLLYRLKNHSTWNDRDNIETQEFHIDEQGVLNWIGYKLKQIK